MIDVVPIRTHPVKASKGRPDSRSVLVAQCHGKPQGYNTEILDYVEVADIGEPDKVLRFDEPAKFWQWVWRHRSTLLILADPNRDMALAGSPGYHVTGRPFRPQPRLYMADYRGSSKNYILNVIGASNWHPEAIYANEVEFGDLVTFARDYVDLVRSNDLGPRLYSTIGAQALQSYRRQVGIEGGNRLRWHRNDELHRFEHEVKSATAPVRIRPCLLYTSPSPRDS